MAEATYYANSTDCTAYAGTSTGGMPPFFATLETPTQLSPAERNTISADDDNYHDMVMNWSGDESPGHHIPYTVTETPTRLDVTAKGFGSGNGSYGWGLWIWNFVTEAYELLDSHVASSKTTLSGAVTANVANYVSAGVVNVVTGTTLRWDWNTLTARLFYTDLKVTYAAAAPARGYVYG